MNSYGNLIGLTIRWVVLLTGWGWLIGTTTLADVKRPFPQSERMRGCGIKPDYLTPAELNSGIANFYRYWLKKYVTSSTQVAGDYKVVFDTKGTTVSEAQGYGMLLTVYLAGADPQAKTWFDGLNRFRKRHPSNLNSALMCWKIPAKETSVSDDCATDGDLDMALALLLAHEQWGDAAYLTEATNYLGAIATALVRRDFSLRLGDWNSAAGQTRPSDFMPGHFHAFYLATRNGLWTNVENKCYAILNQLQTNSAPSTGLAPDFAVEQGNHWIPAPARFLEGPHDGHYFYNSCRVPWRMGWAAYNYGDARARQLLSGFMNWAVSHHETPTHFKAGYGLNGSSLDGNNFDTACFISPTGVAAMATTNQAWLNRTAAYALQRREAYYEDSVSLLSLLVMSGNAWLPENMN